MSTSKVQLPNEAYTVGWISALSTEKVAALAFLDEIHEPPSFVAEHDNNAYTLGRIGHHNVVIAVLPDGEYGNNSATGVARDLLHSFPSIRIGLMVGIGGGAPSPKHDIRLGDVVVSSPGGGYGGVIQYDFGKNIQNQEFLITGVLDQPPTLLRTAVSNLKSTYEFDGHEIKARIQEVLSRRKRLQKLYSPPDSSTDWLFRSDVTHPDESSDCATLCSGAGLTIARPAREEDEDDPKIHYGLVASANQLMKSAIARDKFAAEKDVLCFEMEAAGLMNHYPCLVIRGICDYSDTHKNKVWQGYAAMTAAAYARDLLVQIAQGRIEAEIRIGELVSKFERNLDETKQIAIKTGDGVQHLVSQRQKDKIQDWLSPPDPSINLNTASSLCHPGSGEWFLKGQKYRSWRSRQKAVLWLNGKPGAGKSVLSSVIICDCQSQSALYEDNHTLLYYFFDFNDEAKCSVEGFLKSLVYQAYCQIPGAALILDREHSSCSDTQPSLGNLLRILKVMLARSKHVRIFIDALDECTDRQKHRSFGLLASIRDLYDSIENIQILMTSRPEQDISSFLVPWIGEQALLSLQGEGVDSDICRYVHQSVRTGVLSRWKGRPDVQDEIESTLAEKAGGMFRWVVCQLDALDKCLDLQTLRRALSSLPPDLDETYSRIVQGIPELHLPHTIRILQFLVYADRPLELKEAVDALAVNPDERPRFSPDNRMPLPEEITTLCSSLVSLVSEEAPSWHRERGPIFRLRLAHFSVKEWLTSNRLDTTLARELNEISARTSNARVCLAYLIEWKSLCLKLNVDQQTLAKLYWTDRPFGSYSHKIWPAHARIIESRSPEIRDMALELFAMERAHEALSGSVGSELSLALLRSAERGLTHTAESLIREGAPVDELGPERMNALHLASYSGHEATVDMLLQYGADVHRISKVKPPRKALHLAAELDYARVVGVLLRHGGDINDTTGEQPSRGSVLKAAVREQNEETIKLLIENGVEVHENAVIEAMQWDRSVDILDMLLEQGFDIHAPCGGEKDLLSLVLTKRFSSETGPRTGQCLAAYVPLLLRRGADTRDKGKGNALYLAAQAGGEMAKAVSILLDWDMDVNERSEVHGTALQAACLNNYTDIAMELLDRGADVNMEGGKHGNALHAAIRLQSNYRRYGGELDAARHQRLVSLLIDRGADLDAPSMNYPDALHAAIRDSSWGVFSMLLDKIQSRDSIKRVMVTDQMIGFAATNPYCGDRVMALLLDMCESITFPKPPRSADSAVAVGPLGEDDGPDVSQEVAGTCVQITYDTIKAAACNRDHAKSLLPLLSQKSGQDIWVTENLLLAAMTGKPPEEEQMMALLRRCMDRKQVTTAVLETGFKYQEARGPLLWYCWHASMLDENVASIAFKGPNWAENILAAGFEMGHWFMDELILFAAGLGKPYMSAEFLQAASNFDSVLNEKILTAVAGNETDGAEIMEDIGKIPNIWDTMTITERVVMAAAQNKTCGHEIVDLLHKCHESQMIKDPHSRRMEGKRRVTKLLDDIRNDQRSKDLAAWEDNEMAE